jgi:hypothetical protein
MRLKLEHKKQPVTSNAQFFLRMLRFSFFAILLIAISVGIGMVGYHELADLNWIDSFHMACLILTGMGPVVEMKTTIAKLFSSFYALYSGVAFLTISAVFFSPIIHRILHILNVDAED